MFFVKRSHIRVLFKTSNSMFMFSFSKHFNHSILCHLSFCFVSVQANKSISCNSFQCLPKTTVLYNHHSQFSGLKQVIPEFSRVQNVSLPFKQMTMIMIMMMSNIIFCQYYFISRKISIMPKLTDHSRTSQTEKWNDSSFSLY